MPRNKAWNYWLLIEWFTIYNVRLSLSLYDHIKINREENIAAICGISFFLSGELAR